MGRRRVPELYRAPFPLYALRVDPSSGLLIAAGGGGAAKTGIKNGVVRALRGPGAFWGDPGEGCYTPTSDPAPPTWGTVPWVGLNPQNVLIPSPRCLVAPPFKPTALGLPLSLGVRFL